MNILKLSILFVVFFIVSAVGFFYIDRIVGYGGPPPGDYFARWMERDEQPDCGYPDEAIEGLNRRMAREPFGIQPGAGDDRVFMAAGAIVNIFDSESAATADGHDLLIMRGLYPRNLRFARSGPDLIICGRDRVIQAVVIRQYCHNNSRNPPWNNQIEEIAFPVYRETWLTDALFDGLPAGSDFPDAAYRARRYDIQDEEDSVRWRVKPFRDVLPDAWMSSIDCRITAAQ